MISIILICNSIKGIMEYSFYIIKKYSLGSCFLMRFFIIVFIFGNYFNLFLLFSLIMMILLVMWL